MLWTDEPSANCQTKNFEGPSLTHFNRKCRESYSPEAKKSCNKMNCLSVSVFLATPFMDLP